MKVLVSCWRSEHGCCVILICFSPFFPFILFMNFPIPLDTEFNGWFVLCSIMCQNIQNTYFWYFQQVTMYQAFQVLYLWFLTSYWWVYFQWIDREIVVLQKRIDRANEKGWRREYPSSLVCCKMMKCWESHNISWFIMLTVKKMLMFSGVNGCKHDWYISEFVKESPYNWFSLKLF